ncbi:hypothetical protein KKF84_14360 [Myxococcota bacterium]|nr:hypothetical protein [Myxococcota bacterium]MBU1536505.1 hypothetical protein [Myxococcota bacterium]
MAIIPNLVEKMNSITDRISHFSLLAEGFYTPMRGEHMAQSFPVFMDLKVEVSRVFNGPECVISGTISMETIVENADLHGEIKGGRPFLSPLEINCYFNSPETGESCRLKLWPRLSTLVRWHTKELQLEGTLYTDGNLHSEVTLTLPVEQLMHLFNSGETHR